MLSYQHGFHAANFADVHKHTALCLLIKRTQEKGGMASYLDTHSGRGFYDLTADQSQKTGESLEGYLKITPDQVQTQAFRDYLAAVDQFRQDKENKDLYPGSPALMLKEMSANDRAVFLELHPTEFEFLKENCGADKRANVQNLDALEHILSFVPARTRNGVMLIDPSYEVKDEYEKIGRLAKQVSKRWRAGTICVWYPMLPEGRHEILKNEMKGATFYELVGPLKERGMYGTGLAIYNEPDGFNTPFGQAESEMRDLLF